ncbi:MAG: Stf0 family sulfotransferase [Methylococcaceae bacterium]
MVKFILLANPRTGSTLLRQLLDQHPDIAMYSELFHPFEAERKNAVHAIKTDQGLAYYDNPDEDAFAFLDRMIWHPDNQRRFRAIGFKLFPEHLETKGTEQLFERLQQDKAIRIVHLVRDNLLDVWISRKLAEQSGVWSIPVDGEREPYDCAKWIMLDAEELEIFFNETSKNTECFRQDFAGSRYIELNYEQLVNSTEHELKRLFEFLGVSPLPVKIPLQKQNKRPHTQTVVNYHEIQAFFQQTKYAGFFSTK